MQVGPGCSDIPYWPGTFSSPLRYLRDIPEQIMFKISGFSQIPKQSLRSFQIFSDLFRSFQIFQIFSDLSVLRTLIFCIIMGLLCGLLGAAFNALNIQVGRPVSPAGVVRRVVGRLGAGHGVEIQMVQCIDVWGPRWAGGCGCLIHLSSGNLT